MKTFKQKSTIGYKKGSILEDGITKEVFEVINCVKNNNGYTLELKKHNSYRYKDTLGQLKDALNATKMHDKDLFALNNIVAQLEDEINAS